MAQPLKTEEGLSDKMKGGLSMDGRLSIEWSQSMEEGHSIEENKEKNQ